jgi:hypothetical protein
MQGLIKYHKEIGFNQSDIQALNNLCDELNCMNFKITSHTLDQIKFKNLPIEEIGLFLKDYQINFNDIFEYKKFDEKSNICQIAVRVKFDSQKDIICIISKTKNLITLWFNYNDDKHYTLRKNEYARP